MPDATRTTKTSIRLGSESDGTEQTEESGRVSLGALVVISVCLFVIFYFLYQLLYPQFFCCQFCTIQPSKFVGSAYAPCPNPVLVPNVSAFKGYEGVDACAGDWFMYCMEYQNAHNYTTDTNVSCWKD